ncbi:hypothetical protein C2845_PM03G19350, partial [Panicum miliaceum]
ADNSQELYVRDQLNRGVVPDGIDLHCFTGLIKAWFWELPSGVLDSLTPEQVMHCNTEEECGHLGSTLPPVEAALLEWDINLMADVVENERFNKMNARNIAMVFAQRPNCPFDKLKVTGRHHMCCIRDSAGKGQHVSGLRVAISHAYLLFNHLTSNLPLFIITCK